MANDKMKANADEEQIAGGELTFWKPENPGDEIAGVIVGRRKGKLGDTIMLRVKDEMIGLPSHTTLLTGLDGVAVGETVRVVYGGDKVSKASGMEYCDYSIFLKKRAGSK